MKKIGLKTPPSGTAETMEEAMQIADEIGNYPLIIRPAFTLGGSGGGIAYNVEEFNQIVESGLQASVTTQACPQCPHLQNHTCRSRGACASAAYTVLVRMPATSTLADVWAGCLPMQCFARVTGLPRLHEASHVFS